jgi:hypothetical protein
MCSAEFKLLGDYVILDNGVIEPPYANIDFEIVEILKLPSFDD